MLNNALRNRSLSYLDSHKGVQPANFIPTWAKNEKRLRMVGK